MNNKTINKQYKTLTLSQLKRALTESKALSDDMYFATDFAIVIVAYDNTGAALTIIDPEKGRINDEPLQYPKGWSSMDSADPIEEYAESYAYDVVTHLRLPGAHKFDVYIITYRLYSDSDIQSNTIDHPELREKLWWPYDEAVAAKLWPIDIVKSPRLSDAEIWANVDWADAKNDEDFIDTVNRIEKEGDLIASIHAV